MLIVRFALLAGVPIMGIVSLVLLVVAMLGAGWLVVAIPTMLTIALLSGVAAVWRWWAPSSRQHRGAG
jgi:hypothetical protein